MSQVFGHTNKCEHGCYPRIVCDICFPPLTTEYLDTFSDAPDLLSGGIDLYAHEGHINCEMDGEPMAGVRYITTGLDQKGKNCLMIFTDSWISKQLGAEERPGHPMAARIDRWVKQRKRKSRRGYG